MIRHDTETGSRKNGQPDGTASGAASGQAAREAPANGFAHPAGNGAGGSGHATFVVNGVAVDPTTVEGLVAYHIGKQYRRRPVLRDVTIGVRRGEAVGLLGPNGAGKTTCFYIMTGLTKADSGAIYLDGEEVTDLPMYLRARGGIAYLPQESSIFRGLNVADNIMAVLEVTEPDRGAREARLNQLLADFSVGHLRSVAATALSGGERRRVEIARCLAANPNYVLLDEPLAGIDPIAVADIRDLVSHLKDRGIGVLITDHNVRDTLDIVDRAYVLAEGGVLAEGTPAEIVNDPAVRRVYLGERFSL